MWERENGRISFNLLQHHRSKVQALLFYVFDVLEYRGRSLLNESLSTRRELLSEIFKGSRAPAKKTARKKKSCGRCEAATWVLVGAKPAGKQ